MRLKTGTGNETDDTSAGVCVEAAPAEGIEVGVEITLKRKFEVESNLEGSISSVERRWLSLAARNVASYKLHRVTRNSELATPPRCSRRRWLRRATQAARCW